MGCISKKKQLLILFAAIIIPSLFNINLSGLHLTLYRVAVPSITLLCIAAKYGNFSFGSKIEKQCFITFAIWIGYGIVLMIFRNGGNKGAIKELAGLFFGMLCIYCMVNVIGDSKERFHYAVSAIKVFAVMCIILGLFEIITGMHLMSSIYSNTEFIEAQLATYGSVNTHLATGFQYNPNDYSSFLAFTAPLYLIQTNKKWWLMDWVMIGIIFLICARNSSTLCILALAVCFGYYVLTVGIPLTRKNVLIFAGIIPVGAGVLLYRMNREAGVDGAFSLIFELKNHLHNYQLKQGSSYVRIMIYRDSIRALLDSKLLGIGPNAFTAYFIEHPSASKLVNPHNYWLEILTEYGIFVFWLFLFLLLQLFRKAKALYKKNNCVEGLVLATMFIGYAIVGLEPSSFINYTCQWIPVALTLALLRINLSAEKGVS